MTLIFNGLQEVVKVHVHVNFRIANCSGSWVIVLTEKQKKGKKKKLSDNADNNTAVASAGSN